MAELSFAVAFNANIANFVHLEKSSNSDSHDLLFWNESKQLLFCQVSKV